MMDKLLITDVETNGVDPDKDEIIEVAGALFSVPHETVIATFSWLVRSEAGNRAYLVNGIPPEAVMEHGISQEDSAKRFRAWASRADYIVAHNARFDRAFLDGDDVVGKPWLCSQDDITWPRPSPDQKLVSIALAHGIGVSSAHRASSDVAILCRLFERSSELMVPVRQLIEKALRPRGIFAMVSPRFDREMNDKAKANGFRFEESMGKKWCRRIALEDVDTVAGNLPFEIVRVDQVSP